MSANNETLHSGPVLDGPVQLLLTDAHYNVRRKKDAKHSAYEEVSVSDSKKTVELVRDLPRPGGHAVVLCNAQQFAIWHRFFAAVPSAQHNGSSYSSSSGSKEVFMVSAALLTVVDLPSSHRRNLPNKFWARVIVVDFALHLEKNG